MPYVPGEKTPNPKGIVKDEKAQDRVLIDKEVKKVSIKIANRIVTNSDIATELVRTFDNVGNILYDFSTFMKREYVNDEEIQLAKTIWEVGKAYNYEGAFLGELNYAITRLIQEVPKRLVEQGKQKSELRYFIYALTVEALVRTANYFNSLDGMIGIGGVFLDIKDEYKFRVNQAYEYVQRNKSGDCYDTPYYSKLVEVVNKEGKHIGYVDIGMERTDETLNQDVLTPKLILQ